MAPEAPMNFRTSALVIRLAMSTATLAHGQDQSPAPTPSPAPPATRPMRIRVGGNVAQTAIVHQVAPIYPPLAKAAHISGTVILHAVIARDGTIKELQYVSGPDLLKAAAMDAVKQWQYTPTKLNGEPIEVDTTIQVVFALDGSSPEDSQTSELQSIDPQFKTDILHLFDVMHLQEQTASMGRSMFATLRPTMLAALPPTPNREKIVDAYLEKLVGILASQEFNDGLAVLYAKDLLDDDVKVLADFYQTPPGQRFNAVSSQPFLIGLRDWPSFGKGTHPGHTPVALH
jgi:TonB family protein